MSGDGKDHENNLAAVKGEEESIALARKLLAEDKQMLEEEATKEVEEKQEMRKKRRSEQAQAVGSMAEEVVDTTCHTCGKEFNSEAKLQEHKDGRGHQRAVVREGKERERRGMAAAMATFLSKGREGAEGH